ncbi:luciferase-like monooxygenase [Herbihabitans rhizosphaerae]|uniref:Luciferase-like monooxygenase n=1 Tax=Herbihabitans rhizosphaerae TaxID=1872711 RepID=A0A4Q7L782_9PSEU|nr:LLM class flavin-dependent oxidoreductase [Herbihabitans rhizosphaerae]RZS45146.1 luciferase-like monooxygenase [Herbihabitans rhizosphaerae]
MRVGIAILPEYRWRQAAEKWRAAEEYGFHHAWTMDHLGWRSLVDGPWVGAVPTLTAAATVTSRIRLGTFVASPNFRHPVPFARELMAVDDISDGRFTLGVGAGGGGYDSTVMGGEDLAPVAKHARFTEFVTLLDALLTGERTTFRGEYFTAVEARNAPGCVQRPRLPFVIAANGPKGMRLAAKLGAGWATTGGPWRGGDTDGMDQWWGSVAAVVRKFDETVAAQGVQRFLQLDAAPAYVLSSMEFFADTLGRAAELGFTDVVAPWPRAEGIFAGDESVLERVASDVLPTLEV